MHSIQLPHPFSYFQVIPPPKAIIRQTHSATRVAQPARGATLKRKRSQLSLDLFPPMPTITVLVPSVHSCATDVPFDAPLSEPSSPTPTEIEETDPEPTDTAECARVYGFKARDFAYESHNVRCAPEVWSSPLSALVAHDICIRSPARMRTQCPTGKALHHLLALGWVTQDEAIRHWPDALWEALAKYDALPQSKLPFILVPKQAKPSSTYRTSMRQLRCRPLEDDIPDAMICVPPDEPWMDFGPSVPQQMPAEEPESLRELKRRRLAHPDTKPSEAPDAGMSTTSDTNSAPFEGPQATSPPDNSGVVLQTAPPTPMVAPPTRRAPLLQRSLTMAYIP